jgi:hypothetical protein
MSLDNFRYQPDSYPGNSQARNKPLEACTTVCFTARARTSTFAASTSYH